MAANTNGLWTFSLCSEIAEAELTLNDNETSNTEGSTKSEETATTSTAAPATMETNRTLAQLNADATSKSNANATGPSVENAATNASLRRAFSAHVLHVCDGPQFLLLPYVHAPSLFVQSSAALVAAAAALLRMT
jgi:hypothetical protein